ISRWQSRIGGERNVLRVRPESSENLASIRHRVINSSARLRFSQVFISWRFISKIVALESHGHGLPGIRSISEGGPHATQASRMSFAAIQPMSTSVTNICQAYVFP